MPGIDFDRLRREIPMEQVLDLVNFRPFHRTDPQWYGACPLHDSTSRRPRFFSVNVAIRRYHCHKCHSKGNQLDLWAAATKLLLHPAAIDLCRALGRGKSPGYAAGEQLPSHRRAKRNSGTPTRFRAPEQRQKRPPVLVPPARHIKTIPSIIAIERASRILTTLTRPASGSAPVPAE